MLTDYLRRYRSPGPIVTPGRRAGPTASLSAGGYDRRSDGENAQRRPESDVNIEVQYTESCPNAEVLITALREREGVNLTLTVVSDRGVVPSNFAGSPTVVIDGVNPFSDGQVDAPACALMPPSLARLNAYLSGLSE